MGGPGSGNRWRHGAKDTVEECRAIDVRRWAREGILRPGHWGWWQWTRNGENVASIQMRAEVGRVHLIYRLRPHGGEWEDLSYPVSLERTTCRYGGSRTWFRCPAQGCGRRVAMLYLAGRIFACRHCHRLAYASAREGAGDRAARRADKLRVKLGWEAGILNPPGGKPKGMRWTTFARLVGQAHHLTDQSMREMVRKFGLELEEWGIDDRA
ncbi:MAG: hypothetical protein ACT4QA_00060 [Panacagrimonas sp.]